MLGVTCCRDVRERTNSTCIQLFIPYTSRPFGGLLFACHQVLVLLDLGKLDFTLINSYGIYKLYNLTRQNIAKFL